MNADTARWQEWLAARTTAMITLLQDFDPGPLLRKHHFRTPGAIQGYQYLRKHCLLLCKTTLANPAPGGVTPSSQEKRYNSGIRFRLMPEPSASFMFAYPRGQLQSQISPSPGDCTLILCNVTDKFVAVKAWLRQKNPRLTSGTVWRKHTK